MAVEAIRLTDKQRFWDMGYARTFPGLEAGLIGNLLGQGAGHRVYEYGKDKVLKLPKSHPFYLPLHFTDKKRLVDLLYAYFPGFCLETDILSSPTHPGYAFLQRRLGDYQDITPKNFSLIENQFTELVEKNRRLLEDQKLSLDFLGSRGMAAGIEALCKPSVEPAMTNVVAEWREDQPFLVISDMNLKRLGDQWHPPSLLGLNRYQLIARGVFGINRLLIRHHFGVDIADPGKGVPGGN